MPLPPSHDREEYGVGNGRTRDGRKEKYPSSSCHRPIPVDYSVPLIAEIDFVAYGVLRPEQRSRGGISDRQADAATGNANR